MNLPAVEYGALAIEAATLMLDGDHEGVARFLSRLSRDEVRGLAVWGIVALAEQMRELAARQNADPVEVLQLYATAIALGRR